ncbi:MAG: hypothetical protein ABI672_12560 [Vicinamibacteria bacterium]
MPSRRIASAVGGILLAGLTLGSVAFIEAANVVERTMAFINKKPVLLSEVQLTQILLQINPEAALEKTIDEDLMFEESSRLLSTVQDEKELEAATTVLRAKAGPGFSDAAIKRKAQMQLSIARYIEIRMRPQARVEDTEVRRLFDEKAVGDPKAPEFVQVEPSIRESLERRALDRKIEEWVTSLRQRAEIRRPVHPVSLTPPAGTGSSSF